MADIDSLNYKSISEMSNDEAIELLRTIRLNRRVVKATTKKAKAQQKAVTVSKLSDNQVDEVLAALMGGSK